MSEKYRDSKGDLIVLAGLAGTALCIVLLAFFFRATPAKAFPSDWSSEKTCASAGNRPGTDKPAWCPEFREDGSIGCVPCPRAEPVQWVGPYRKRTWSIDRRRKACQLKKRCW